MLENASYPISVILDGITNSPLILLFLKTESPIVVTLDGITNSPLIWLLENA